jgi:hypothetical protein
LLSQAIVGLRCVSRRHADCVIRPDRVTTAHQPRRDPAPGMQVVEDSSAVEAAMPLDLPPDAERGSARQRGENSERAGPDQAGRASARDGMKSR